MAPKRATRTTPVTTTPATTTTVTNAQLQAMIDQGVSAALAHKMTDKYCPRNKMKKLEAELWNLKVIGTDVVKYNQCFQELALLCVRMFPEEADKIKRESIPIAERQAEIRGSSKILPKTVRINNNNKSRGKTRQGIHAGSGVSRKQYGGSRPLCSICITTMTGYGKWPTTITTEGTGSGQKHTCFEVELRDNSERIRKECRTKMATVVIQLGMIGLSKEVHGKKGFYLSGPLLLQKEVEDMSGEESDLRPYQICSDVMEVFPERLAGVASLIDKVVFQFEFGTWAAAPVATGTLSISAPSEMKVIIRAIEKSYPTKAFYKNSSSPWESYGFVCQNERRVIPDVH
ncbi:hypothetical protein Tco_0989166 [Tanacetum coccineum]|uniref:Reverse transcriptase domain-containing protein n=1 Tax=Tanacetum coccineum TaxID=301880 RepID=A0ABQ5EUA3_9ASTR